LSCAEVDLPLLNSVAKMRYEDRSDTVQRTKLRGEMAGEYGDTTSMSVGGVGEGTYRRQLAKLVVDE